VFVDTAKIKVHGGNGGAGCVSFLRTKTQPGTAASVICILNQAQIVRREMLIRDFPVRKRICI